MGLQISRTLAFNSAFVKHMGAKTNFFFLIKTFLVRAAERFLSFID